MTDDTLAKALADVRQRRSDLQAEHERIAAELAKLRVAEASLAALVEGASLDEAEDLLGGLPGGPSPGPARTGRRGARGPRANSAKGRLRALLDGAGPQGLTHAEIARRLPDVAPATLNAYLSGMASSGEAVRAGDFYRSGGPSEAADAADDETADDAADAQDEAAA